MSLYSVEQQQFGVAKESVRGTAESIPTKWYPSRGMVGLDYVRQHLQDTGLRGAPNKFPAIKGIKAGTAKIPLFYDPQHVVEFFQGLLGTVTSAEESVITISSSNNKLNFDIGAGELTATIDSGSYPIGLSQATSGTLCAEIRDALLAADGTGTYTVTYSRSTKLFTIARSTGTFNLLASTGTNVANGIWSTIGFAATDRTGSTTYAGTVQVEYAFKHTITQSTAIQKQAFTWFADRGLGVMKYNLGCVKGIGIKGTNEGLIEMDVDGIFKTEASGSIGSPSYPAQKFLAFQHADVKVAGSSNTDVKEWELKIDNSAQPHRPLALSEDLSDVLCPGKLMIEGGLTIYFQNTTERDKFIANTATTLRFLCESDIINGSSKWGIDVNLYDVRYNAFPYGEDQGLLAAKATFEGYYSTSDSKAIQVDVKNQDVSY